MGALAHATTAALAGTGWQLQPEGLEHAPTGYFIEAGALGSRRADGHWEWPLHMAEKAWCAPLAFRDAFLAALTAFGVRPDARLAESFALARGEREARVAQPTQDRFVLLGELCAGSRPSRSPSRRQPERARTFAAPAPEPARKELAVAGA
jgi:hypothetical protein